MAQKMKSQEFFKALEGARMPTHGEGHPLSRAWANGELNRGHLGFYATQHFYYIDAIPQQFAHLYCRLPDLDARQHLMENLIGEEMPSQPDKRHPELMLKFGQACGLERQDIMDAEKKGEIVPGARAMRAWIWELVGFRTLAEACAGIMVALEGQLPTLYPKYIKAMRNMGYTNDDLEFFIVHVENDTEHAHIGLELCDRYATTPELQELAVQAVKTSGRLRWQMLDSIFGAMKLQKAAE
jgi:pyrroloquinoline-quinone synthase